MYTTVTHGFRISGQILNNVNNESYDVSGYIVDIMVRKRFLEEVFPLFVIDFRFTQELRDMLRDNDCLIHLKCSYFTLSNSDASAGDDTDILAEEGIVFDTNIRPYNIPFEATYSKSDDENDSTDNAENSTPLISYRVSGIPDESISINEEIVNTVYRDSNLASILVNLISSKTKNFRCKIQQPENTFLYKNVLVPPMSLVEAINYLDEHYNIYNNTLGASLFIDTDSLYLYTISSNSIPTDNILEYYVKSEEATANTDNDGILKLDLENNNMKIQSKYIPGVNIEEKISAHEVGSQTIFYSYDDNYNLVIREGGNSDSYKKIRYLWNNDNLKEHELADIAGSKLNHSLTLSLSNINPSLITPYTTVRVNNSEFNKINGDYTVSEISYILTSGSGKNYSDTLVLTCIKRI